MTFACIILASLIQFAAENSLPLVSKPDLEATVDEIAKAYADNPITAGKMYLRKNVKVTGQIAGISKVPKSSSYYVTFKTPGDTPVTALFQKEHLGQLEKAKKGDTVSVTGFFAGPSLGKLLLTRCTELEKK